MCLCSIIHHVSATQLRRSEASEIDP